MYFLLLLVVRMLESVANLKKKAKKGASAESGAFQQLFLLVGMHLFKVEGSSWLKLNAALRVQLFIMKWFVLKAPDELLDIMKDLQSCMDKAQEKKAKKKKKKTQQGE